MFSNLPNWIKYVFGATFLGIGGVLMVFAVGGMLGFFQEDLEPLPPLNSTVKDTIEEQILFPDNAEVATFAAGCFWCTEAAFQEEAGVLDAVSGFAGGTSVNPTYDEVVRGKTDYREAVQVTYNPDVISYDRLLEIFWESIDPVDGGGQFVDRGLQYTTAAFRHSEEQKSSIEDSLLEEQVLHEETIATKILPYTTFTAAEAYHQDFYKNSKERYGRYKKGSGREKYWEEREKSEEGRVENKEENSIESDSESGNVNITDRHAGLDPVSRDNPSEYIDNEAFDQDDKLEELESLLGNIFADESDEEVVTALEGEQEVVVDAVSVSRDSSNFVQPTKKKLKEQLSYMQYRVTQDDGTEPPFANDYWDNKQEGIYVDIVSGEPLFSSRDKYKSGTGWPSFTQPIGGDTSVMTTHEDTSLWSTRTELRSTVADSHLGHLFDDGPVSRGGLRYCMNSAGMNFIPYEEMDSLGYGDFMKFVK